MHLGTGLEASDRVPETDVTTPCARTPSYTDVKSRTEPLSSYSEDEIRTFYGFRQAAKLLNKSDAEVSSIVTKDYVAKACLDCNGYGRVDAETGAAFSAPGTGTSVGTGEAVGTAEGEGAPGSSTTKRASATNRFGRSSPTLSAHSEGGAKGGIRKMEAEPSSAAEEPTSNNPLDLLAIASFSSERSHSDPSRSSQPPNLLPATAYTYREPYKIGAHTTELDSANILPGPRKRKAGSVEPAEVLSLTVLGGENVVGKHAQTDGKATSEELNEPSAKKARATSIEPNAPLSPEASSLTGGSVITTRSRRAFLPEPATASLDSTPDEVGNLELSEDQKPKLDEDRSLRSASMAPSVTASVRTDREKREEGGAGGTGVPTGRQNWGKPCPECHGSGLRRSSGEHLSDAEEPNLSSPSSQKGTKMAQKQKALPSTSPISDAPFQRCPNCNILLTGKKRRCKYADGSHLPGHYCMSCYGYWRMHGRHRTIRLQSHQTEGNDGQQTPEEGDTSGIEPGHGHGGVTISSKPSKQHGKSSKLVALPATSRERPIHGLQPLPSVTQHHQSLASAKLIHAANDTSLLPALSVSERPARSRDRDRERVRSPLLDSDLQIPNRQDNDDTDLVLLSFHATFAQMSPIERYLIALKECGDDDSEWTKDVMIPSKVSSGWEEAVPRYIECLVESTSKERGWGSYLLVELYQTSLWDIG